MQANLLVRTYPRIHLSLIDLGYATLRRLGGAGFTIAGLPTEIEAFLSDKNKLIGLDNIDVAARRQLLRAFDKISKFNPQQHGCFHLKLKAPQHIGLGSKTASMLALLEAANHLWNLNLRREIIQRMSGRGGTSGIGINTFFKGGFITDAGHPLDRANSFQPSSSSRSNQIPPIITRLRTPTNWRFFLILPPGEIYTSNKEIRFFRNNTPIPKREVLITLSLIYHGIVPAVILGDLKLLKDSIKLLRKYGFKRREIEGQPDCVYQTMRLFDDLRDCAVGMSSMGPLVYVIADKNNSLVEDRAQTLCNGSGYRLLGVFSGRNYGRKVIV